MKRAAPEDLVFSTGSSVTAADEEREVLFISTRGHSLVELSLAEAPVLAVRPLTSDLNTWWSQPSPVGRGIVFAESARREVVIDRGPHRSPIRAPGSVFAVLGSDVLVAGGLFGPEGVGISRIDTESGDIQPIAPVHIDFLGAWPDGEVALARAGQGPSVQDYLYWRESGTWVPLEASVVQVFRRGVVVGTGTWTLLSPEGEKQLPPSTVSGRFGSYSLCLGSGRQGIVQRIDASAPAVAVDFEAALVFSRPSKHGCVFAVASGEDFWVGLDGTLERVGHAAVDDEGGSIWLGLEPPVFYSQEKGRIVLEMPPRGLPVACTSFYERADFLRVTCLRGSQEDPRVALDFELPSGRFLRERDDSPDTQGWQPGAGPWLAATDSLLDALVPHAVDLATGRSRPLSEGSESLVNFGLRSVITLGSKAVFLVRDEVVDRQVIRPVAVDLSPVN